MKSDQIQIHNRHLEISDLWNTFFRCSLEHFGVQTLLFFLVLLLRFLNFSKLCSHALVIGLEFFDTSEILKRELKILTTQTGLRTPEEGLDVVWLDLDHLVAYGQRFVPMLEKIVAFLHQVEDLNL